MARLGAKKPARLRLVVPLAAATILALCAYNQRLKNTNVAYQQSRRQLHHATEPHMQLHADSPQNQTHQLNSVDNSHSGTEPAIRYKQEGLKELPLSSSIRSYHHSPIKRARLNNTQPQWDQHFNSFYHILENVQLDWVGKEEVGVVAYHHVNETVPYDQRLQPIKFRHDVGPKLQLATHYKAYDSADASPLAKCTAWVEEPAIIFHVPYPDNVFHFFNDGFLPVLHTLMDSGLLPDHVARVMDTESGNCHSDTCSIRSPVPTQVMLIAIRPDVFHQKNSYLLEHISAMQMTLLQMNGYCFRKLIIGASALLDMYGRGFDNETLKLRKPLLQSIQRYMMASALTDKLQRLPPATNRTQAVSDGCLRVQSVATRRQENATAAAWNSGRQRPQVTLASRTAPATRSVINEPDIVRFMKATWEVDVMVTGFNGSLYDTIDMMQRTDVFVGMHGAGLTNAMFLPQGSSMVQLIPFGWNYTTKGSKKVSIVRGSLYKHIAEALQLPHHYWINGEPHHAFFQGRYFDAEGQMPDYRLHPTPAMKRPTNDLPPAYWIYQHTWVDIPTLEPVLEKAFAAVGIKRRQPPLSFKAEIPLPVDKEADRKADEETEEVWTGIMV